MKLCRNGHDKDLPGGRTPRGRCRPCHDAGIAAYYATHLVARRAQFAARYVAHRAEVIAKNSARYAAHPSDWMVQRIRLEGQRALEGFTA